MEESIKFAKGKKFAKYIAKEQIEEINTVLADRINKDYAGKKVLFIVVM